MGSYRRKPTVIEAVRYGRDEDGSWYPDAVARVAAFILKAPEGTVLTDRQICDVVTPTGAWDPPGHADVLIMDRVAHQAWLPLVPGDWVIRGIQGEVYPCKNSIFEATYEPIGGEEK